MSTTTDRPCKACGVELRFVKNARTGKLLPLERVTVYEVIEGSEPTAEPHQAWISHFKTCTEPNKFSRRA